jgi:UDP-N-acetylmuramoyl-L-alanyl-D-glutamate--2,6-diaminopimelate ligase
MPKVLLKDLIMTVEGATLLDGDDVIIRGIEYDSRNVQPEYLFVAVPGFKQDGMKFIPDAVERGAAAVLAERDPGLKIPAAIAPSPRKALADVAARFHDYPGKKIEICGTTGTNGKSTVVTLIRKMREVAGYRCGMLNSLEYDTGVRKYRAERTTPESLETQSLLWEMVENHCDSAVIEVSSHALLLNRVDHIDFKIGVFTTFSRDHLDFHKDMDDYLDTKKLLLDKLAGDNKCAVINMDVPEFSSFISDAPCRVLTYSAENNQADITFGDVLLHPEHSHFKLTTPSGSGDVRLQLPGRYNLTNAAAAAGAGIAMGIELDKIIRALGESKPLPGRFVPVILGQPFSVIVDFAHTPDAIDRLCQSARELTPEDGRLLILFGCGGDRDRGKRPLMGQTASENSDAVIITSDNPRTEDPGRIIDDVMPGIKNNNTTVIPDRREAINEILHRAKPGDTVLIAGKGAENYQDINGVRHPFEDKKEVTAVLQAMGYTKGSNG